MRIFITILISILGVNFLTGQISYNNDESYSLEINAEEFENSYELYLDGSNGSPLFIKFDYAVLLAQGLSNHAASINWGQLDLVISSDNGINWDTIYTIADKNHIPSPASKTVEIEAPSDLTPMALPILFEFRTIGNAGDNLLVLDSIAINQECILPMSAGTTDFVGEPCLSVLEVRDAQLIPGLEYTWQISTDSITWEDFSSTRDSFHFVSKGDSYYRRKFSCGEDSTFSEPLFVPASNEPTYYSGPFPYRQGFENWQTQCSEYEVPDEYWRAAPVFGAFPWNRNDVGPDNFRVDAIEGAHFARCYFNDFDPDSFESFMDFYVDMSSLDNPAISFDYFNISYSEDLEVLYSLDGFNFFRLGLLGRSSAWKKYSFQIPKDETKVIIRFKAIDYNYALVNLGIDNFYFGEGCSGTPIPGEPIATPLPACAGEPITLTLVNSPDLPGNIYRWSSFWGKPARPTTTNRSFTIDDFTGKSQRVYCTTICTYDDSSVTTSESVYLTPYTYNTYNYFEGPFPFFEDFEDWDECKNVPSQYWENSPSGFDVGCRQFKQPPYWRNLPDEDSENFVAAVPLSFFKPNNNKNSFELNIDLTGRENQILAFDYVQNRDTEDSEFLIEIAKDGTPFDTIFFQELGRLTLQPMPVRKFYELPIAEKATIRFVSIRNNFDSNSGVNLYFDNLYVGDICELPSIPGHLEMITDPTCLEDNFNLVLRNSLKSPSIRYTLEQKRSGQPWEVVFPAGIDTIYNLPFQSARQYRVKAECFPDNAVSYSDTILVENNEVDFYKGPFPYVESFENWTEYCETTAPSAYCRNMFTDNRIFEASETFYYGYSRYEDYADATHQNQSARIEDESGGLDFYVDLSGLNSPILSFDFLNAEFDQVFVHFSKDYGETFQQLGILDGEENWSKVEFQLPNDLEETIFRIFYKENISVNRVDFGIDNFRIGEGCSSDFRVEKAITSKDKVKPNEQFNLSLENTNALNPDFSYRWQSSRNNQDWFDLPDANYISLTLSQSEPTFYRCEMTCAGGDLKYSTSVQVMIDLPTQFYPGPYPYRESFETWVDSLRGPNVYWENTFVDRVDLWQRYDNPHLDEEFLTPFPDGNYCLGYDLRYAVDYNDFDFNADLSALRIPILSFQYLNPTGNDKIDVLYSVDGGYFDKIGEVVNANEWETFRVNLPSNSPTSVIRLLGVPSTVSNWEQIVIDNFQISDICDRDFLSSKSVVGSPICSSKSNQLTLEKSPGADFNYYWEFSEDSIDWQRVGDLQPHPNFIFERENVSSEFWARATMVCPTKDFEKKSEPVKVEKYGPYYSGDLPYFQGFEQWENYCDSLDIPDIYWKNSPSIGRNSWRRYDQTSAAYDGNLWQSINMPGTEGSNCARFFGEEGTKGELDFSIDLTDANSVAVSFDYHLYRDNEFIEVLYSINGEDFILIDSVDSALDWEKYQFELPADFGKTIIRFRATNDEYHPDIGIDNFKVAEICTMPSTLEDFVYSHTSVCPGEYFTFSKFESELEPNQKLVLQSSLDGVSWNDIEEVHDRVISLTQSVPIFYRFEMSCASSTDKIYSEPILIDISVETPYYDGPFPFHEGFENWENKCSELDVPSAHWQNLPFYGQSSFRRNDQRELAGGTRFNSSGNIFSEGEHAAIISNWFEGGGVPRNERGSLELFIDLTELESPLLVFDYHMNGSRDSLMISYSTDGLTFVQLDTFIDRSTLWKTYSRILPDTLGKTIIRLTANSWNINVNFGIDNFEIQESCNQNLYAGEIKLPENPVCLGLEYTLNLEDFASNTGVANLWQESNDGVTWENLWGGGFERTITPTSPVYYRVIANCNDIYFDTTQVFLVDLKLPEYYDGPFPYIQDFEEWKDFCDEKDIPDDNWLNTPPTGVNSWRRHVDGNSADWPVTNSFDSIPAASGDYAARFLASETNGNGNLDFYLDLTSISNSLLSFDYINTGFSPLSIQVSEDGINFNEIGDELGYFADWERYIYPLPRAVEQLIIRFEADGQYRSDESDIAIDSLVVREGKGISAENLLVDLLDERFCENDTLFFSLVDDFSDSLFSFQWELSYSRSPNSLQDMVGQTKNSGFVIPERSGYIRCKIQDPDFDAPYLTPWKYYQVVPDTNTVTNITQRICRGDTILFNGIPIYNIGNYNQTFTVGRLCDSIVNLSLHFYPNHKSFRSHTVAPGGLFFGIPIFSDTSIVENHFDKNGCDSIVTHTITVVTSSTNDALAEKLKFNLYPNPADAALTLEYLPLQKGEISISVFDILGRKVKTIFENEYHQTTPYNRKLNIEDLSPGIYLVRLKTEVGIIDRKFFKE